MAVNGPEKESGGGQTDGPDERAHLVFGLGVLVALISVLADAVGIGVEPGFGYKQGAGFLVGIALIIAGAWWKRRR